MGGLIPLADARDALIAVRRRDNLGLITSLAAMVPIVGDAATATARTARNVRHAAAVAEAVDDVRTATTYVRSRRVPTEPASDDVERHPAGLEPAAEDATERDGRRDHAGAVR